MFFCLLAPNNFHIIRFYSLSAMTVLGGGYYRNDSCALGWISTFLLLTSYKYNDLLKIHINIKYILFYLIIACS